jgi:hypothetical protein
MPAPTIAGTPRGTDEFTWSLTFKPLGAQLSNGTIDVGVHNSGALGYQSVGVESQGIQNPFLQDGWGISDGSTHSAVDASSYNPEILGDLELSSFTSGDGWAESVTTMGDLKVTHHFRPSADPNLFAVDVTVERVAPAAPSSGHVTYRRTMEWGDSMWQEYLTWARSPDGNDSAVATLTDARSAPDPRTRPWSTTRPATWIGRSRSTWKGRPSTWTWGRSCPVRP